MVGTVLSSMKGCWSWGQGSQVWMDVGSGRSALKYEGVLMVGTVLSNMKGWWWWGQCSQVWMDVASGRSALKYEAVLMVGTGLSNMKGCWWWGQGSQVKSYIIVNTTVSFLIPQEDIRNDPWRWNVGVCTNTELRKSLLFGRILWQLQGTWE